MMSFPINWSCPHCGHKDNGLIEKSHLKSCKQNPKNWHYVDLYFGDRQYYKTIKVFANSMDEALRTADIPAGGYAKPSQR